MVRQYTAGGRPATRGAPYGWWVQSVQPTALPDLAGSSEGKEAPYTLLITQICHHTQ